MCLHSQLAPQEYNMNDLDNMKQMILLVESADQLDGIDFKKAAAEFGITDEGTKMGLTVGASGANLGAMAGSAVFPGVGTVIGAILGGAYGFSLGRQINDWEDIKIWFKSAGLTLNKEEKAQKILAKGESEFDTLSNRWQALKTDIKKSIDTDIPEMIKLVEFNQFDQASQSYSGLRGSLFALRSWDLHESNGFDETRMREITDKLKQKIGLFPSAKEADRDYIVHLLKLLHKELSQLNFDALPNDIEKLIKNNSQE
jgi:uncharacterized protein (DUF697 family)